MRSFSVKAIVVVCWVVLMCSSAAAQLSELRQSRLPLPGILDISRVGITVDLGAARHLVNSDVIIDTIQSRLESVGYRVSVGVTPSPVGLWLQIDCQAIQQKNEILSRVSAIQALPKVSRLGPPCQFTYLYHQELISWKNVDRFIYSESVSTMQKLAQLARNLSLEECVELFFRMYDFPVLLAAEWGHVNRLLHELSRPETPVSRQGLILTLLGETRAGKGYPILLEKLNDMHVAKEAAEALGLFGLRAQPYLLSLVQDDSNSMLQAAAAKGLGRIAALSGNSQYTPLYMKMVADEMIDIQVRTQLIWALGMAPDMQAYPTLLQLEQHIWDDPSQDPQLEEFRAAVDWSIREVKQGGHGDDF